MRLKSVLIVLILVAGITISLLPSHSSAGSGSIYLSPGSESVQNGNTITFALRINPGTSVNAVQATVNYNQSYLQYVSTTGIATFSACPQNTGGGGSVTLSCANLSGNVSSDSLIANITFQAVAGSGSSSLTLSNANAASGGSYTNPSSSGASVAFTSPATPPPSTPQTPTGSNNTQSSTTTKHTSTTPPKTTTTSPGLSNPTTPSAPTTTPSTSNTPKVTINSTTQDVQFTKVSFKVTSNVEDKYFIKYGIDKNNLNESTPPTSPVKSAVINLDPALLTPGTKYYYQVVSQNSLGTIVAQTPVKSITTKGYSFSVTVLDSKYKPLVGQVVTLHSSPMTATTNKQGIATFNNVAPGAHHVIYQANGSSYSQSVFVSNNFTSNGSVQLAQPQNAAVILSEYTQPKSLPTGFIIGSIFSIIIVGYVIIAPRLINKAKSTDKKTSIEKMNTIFSGQVSFHHK